MPILRCKLRYFFYAIFSLFIANVHAENIAWVVHKETGVQIASTTNDTGSVTGILCNTDKEACVAYISLTITCEEGHFYPLMSNSSVGSFIFTSTCTIFRGAKYFVLDDFENAIQTFESGGEIGFAMPMASGHFRVIRFGTAGATAAIKEARKPPIKSKTDQVM